MGELLARDEIEAHREGGEKPPASATCERWLCEASGRWRALDAAAILDAEGPHIDIGRFNTELGERGADLAAMIGPVVQRLAEHDTGSVEGIGPVVVGLHKHRVGIDVAPQDSRPNGAVVLHSGAE